MTSAYFFERRGPIGSIDLYARSADEHAVRFGARKNTAPPIGGDNHRDASIVRTRQDHIRRKPPCQWRADHGHKSRVSSVETEANRGRKLAPKLLK